jgi:hypothetical protein
MDIDSFAYADRARADVDACVGAVLPYLPVVMDAFGYAVVGWVIHGKESAEVLALGLAARLRAVIGVVPGFRPASIISDDEPAEHNAIRCGPAGHVSD